MDLDSSSENMFKCIRSGSVSLVARILKHMPELVNARLNHDSGNTALMKATAVIFHSVEMVALLLSEGATLDLVNDRNQDAVHYACSAGANPAVLDLLLRAWTTQGGYDWRLRDCDGTSAFLAACASINIKLLGYLLDIRTHLTDYEADAVWQQIRYVMMRIERRWSEQDIWKLVSHAGVSRAMEIRNSPTIFKRFTLSLDKLNVGLDPIVVYVEFVECFMRARLFGWESVIHALYKIHPNAIRALSVLNVDRFYGVHHNLPIVVGYAEAFRRHFMWPNSRDVFLIRYKATRWSIIGALPESIFWVVLGFCQQPFDRRKVADACNGGFCCPWRAVLTFCSCSTQ